MADYKFNRQEFETELTKWNSSWTLEGFRVLRDLLSVRDAVRLNLDGLIWLLEQREANGVLGNGLTAKMATSNPAYCQDVPTYKTSLPTNLY